MVQNCHALSQGPVLPVSVLLDRLALAPVLCGPVDVRLSANSCSKAVNKLEVVSRL